MNDIDKILAVDDNSYNLLFLEKIIQSDERILLKAESGSEAISILKDNPDISLIIMDVQMPIMNGFDTVKAIKEDPNFADLPVIFVTGIHRSEDFVDKGFNLGAYDYIYKPFESHILRNKVSLFLTLYKQKKQLIEQTRNATVQKEYLSKVLASVPSILMIVDHDYNKILLNNVFTDLQEKYPELSINRIMDELKSELDQNFLTAKESFREIHISLNNSDYLYFNAYITQINLENSNKPALLSLTDITLPKKNENNLISINRSLKILSELNLAMIFGNEVNELLYAFCEILTIYGEYPLVLITDSNDKNNEFTPIAYSGTDKNFIDNLKCLNGNNLDPHCPLKLNLPGSVSQLIISKFEGCSDCPNNPVKFGYRQFVTMPLKVQNSFKGFLYLFLSKDDEIEASEKVLINDMTNYLQYGIESINERKKRKNAEEALATEKDELIAYLGSITDGVISVNKSGIILMANHAAEEILAYKEGELYGKSIFEVVHLLNKNNNKILFNPLDWIQNQRNKGPINRQITILSKDQIRKILSVTASEIGDNIGNFKGFVLVFVDITERLRIENMQALSQKMESVGQLAAGIAHEINTPMQFVGDNTYFLKDGFDSLLKYLTVIKEFLQNPQYKNNPEELAHDLALAEEEMDIDYLMKEIPEAINRTMNGVDRVSKLVLAMKNFAHPSGKSKSLNNINQGIDVTVTISRNEWKYLSDIELDLDPNLPLVKCSLDEINQVILNMIINASHAIEEVNGKNPEKKGTITIKTEYNEEFVTILISDTGMGIKEEHLSRIFDPFFTTKEVGKGTGQGLSIAHDIIVNKHGGKIQVESELGKGTTFTIRLPIDSEEKQEA